MAAPMALCIRAAAPVQVRSGDLVPGDVVLLQAGNVVPADLRLVEVADLEVDEAALTGESAAVLKTTAPLREESVPLGDYTNLAFKGTQVNRGRGVGLVIATGMATELGRIAALLHTTEEGKTPLQRRLAAFGKRLALAVLAICAVVFAVGLLRGEPLVLMFLTAISLAVAAIPEALPAVVSITLALGARRMTRHRALVRNLPAVETLGSVTFICSDKTGTLTQNQMHVDRLFAGERELDSLPSGGGELERRLAQAMALSNDAELRDGEIAGEPTEVALCQAARIAGYDKKRLAHSLPRIAELAFDSDRKRMTTLHREGDAVIGFTKGAPELVLPLCERALGTAGEQSVDAAAMLQRAEALAARGYRVLVLAMRHFATPPEQVTVGEIERHLTFLALVALIDPPRDEVPAAVAECRRAGITPVMITGDHPATAETIAHRLGFDPRGEVLDGVALAQLDDDQLLDKVRRVSVYARVSPEQKIRIVAALQRAGQFCAMTGDGVNDAPALKRADIGIAMGQKGTDVAREAADLVLLDDNFATIVTAVREGRRIFDNIRKFIKYTMTSNAGEIWTLFLAPFLGLPVPLLPIHILWINLVTDGLPGLALAAERTEPGTMQRPPRAPDESVFAHGMWQHIVWVGLLIGGVSLLAQAWAFERAPDQWQTMVFTVLTFAQLAHVLVIRSERAPLFGPGFFKNRALLASLLLTVALQLALIYVPLLNEVFKTAALGGRELALCFALPLVVLLAVETEKLLVRRGLLYQNEEETQPAPPL
jgi:Ca2+-transporting ATPase